ncbi:MAG: hypothetical protein MUF01_09840 [Bryobacterales bacterium]|jgi:hypothetical protein|nr:hypothetical protein [Bryobacterales bacterium]
MKPKSAIHRKTPLMVMAMLACLVAELGAQPTSRPAADGPLRVHPSNGRYFT